MRLNLSVLVAKDVEAEMMQASREVENNVSHTQQRLLPLGI